MTKRELVQLRSIRQEIEDLKELQKEMIDSLGESGRQTWGKEREKEAERLQALGAQLDGLNDRIDARRHSLAKAYRHTMDWLDAIPDSELRRIYMLRYMMGKSWQQVANALGNTASSDAVQIRAKRFLQKN